MMGWADIPSARVMGMWLHRDQVDKAGEPYALHLEAVASRAQSLCERLEVRDHVRTPIVCAAWLHDAVEDGHATVAEIERFLGSETAQLVASVTRDKSESYWNFIQRIATASGWAYVVKVSDLFSNLDPDRVGRLDEKEAERLCKRYTQALGVLVWTHPRLVGL